MNRFCLSPVIVLQARERLHDVREERLELRMRISVEIARKLVRVQELESVKTDRSISVEEAIEVALNSYLNTSRPRGLPPECLVA